MIQWLWPHRTALWLRREPNGNHIDLGLTWYEWSRFNRARYRTPLSIAFAFVATHNHFVLDRGGKVFNRSAPVIKLPPEATEDDHLALLGLLNSSTACFWMKQVYHNKGATSDRGVLQADPAKFRYEFDGTKLQRFPVPEMDDDQRRRLVSISRMLDLIGGKLACFGIDDIVGSATPSDALIDIVKERKSHRRQMVRLQWRSKDMVIRGNALSRYRVVE